MRLLTVVVLIVVGLPLAPAGFPATSQGQLQSSAITDEVPSTCPVTRPSGQPFLPPAPYPSVGQSWIGSEKLWTYIPGSGIWSGLPHYTPDDSRFRQKLFWWHEGYDRRTEKQPALTIVGQRLDGSAPPITTDEHANAGWTDDQEHPFIVAGIFIPTVGCWQITGQYEGEELSYVVWVSDSRPSAKSSGCSSNDLLARMKLDDPAYTPAMTLAQALGSHGFVIRCVLQSKMVAMFEGQQGAAFFRTDKRDFDVLFLPNPQTFDSVEIVSRQENGRFLYSFRGSPRPTSPHTIDSAYPMFFVERENQLFVTDSSQLAASIAKAVM